MTAPAPPAAGWVRRLAVSPTVRSVLWQALGSAATVAAALWVSGRMGLRAQGEFGLAKSWFDAATAFAALGLPQGLLHLQYRLKLPATALRPWLVRILITQAMLAALAAPLLWWAGARLAAMVVLSVPFGAGHLLARSLLLPRRGAEAFGLATALPALLVLAGVGAIGVWRWSMDFAWPLLLATVLSATITLSLAWPRGSSVVAPASARKELWHASLQSWVQQALTAMLVAALLSAVAASGQSAEALGAASLGLQLYQVFVVLIGYASPLLFDRLARHEGVPLQVTQLRTDAHLAAAVCVLLLAAGAALLLWPGLQHQAWALPMLLMLPAGVAAVAVRLVATVLLAQGRYGELSLQALGRLLLGLGLLVPALRLMPAAAALAATLLAVELATWWRCRHCLREVT